MKLVFQSTLPRGSDEGLNVMYLGKKVFQSTLPRGSDKQWCGYRQHQQNFNPRSLAGATRYGIVYTSRLKLFQSTLPRGSDVRPKSG